MKLELEEIKDEIAQISKERDIDESKAFALFFLCRIHDLSEEEAEKIITDGPWDGGLDAFYYDDENRRLYLYQFKYTENANYALSGIEDLVRAVRELFRGGSIIEIKNEKIDFNNVDSIHVSLVTLAKLEEINGKPRKDFEKEKTKNLKIFFKRKNINVDCKFEIFDYYKIEEILFGIGGIPKAIFDVSKGFLRAKDDTGSIEIIVTLLKGEELAELCEKFGNDLFESNVRRFLGLRKRSVNWNILETLENANDRNFFVAYNNGIVAVCKNFKIIEDGKKLILERFAIVNGAQTVNVLLKAKERNFDFSNVYVLAKIVKTQDWEIAKKIARAANSQNPTNVRDLRSLDKIHKELEGIFSKFGFTYVYKRGIGLRRKSPIVNMKDLAQAYVAFYLGKPYIAYGRVDKIFSEDEYYDRIFDFEKIEKTKKEGRIEELVIEYIVPYLLLMKIREKLRNRKTRPIDPAFTYHILWLFGSIYNKLQRPSTVEEAQKLANELFEKYFNKICQEFDACVNYCKEIEIPRSLKSAEDFEKFITVKERVLKEVR